MSRIARFLPAALMMLTALTGTAQPCKRDLHEAAELWRKGLFQKASSLLEPGFECLKRNSADLLLSSQIHLDANRMELAEKGFLHLYQKGYKPRECLRALAEISHHRLRFREAIHFYKELYAHLKKNDPARNEIINKINACVLGIQLSKAEPLAWVESLSSSVNSDQDEFAPYPSPTHPGRYYFSAVREDCQGGRRNEEGEPDPRKGKLRSDLYVYESDPNQGQTVRELSRFLSSNYEDRISAVSSDGRVLIFFQTWDGDAGRLRSDTFSENRYRFEYPEFKTPLRPDLGDQEFCLFQDSIIVFSSDRMGGYGGKDLYLTIFRSGAWSEPVNLGSAVNSSFDETDPWLARDGRTLYFVSNGPGSLGGYDVFKTSFGAEQKGWRKPENLGLPINSPGHERQFRLNPDGISAVFCSDRKQDNAGLRDLYLAVFRVELREQSRPPAGSVLSLLADDPYGVIPAAQKGEKTVRPNSPVQQIDKKKIALRDLPFGGTDFQKDPRYKKMLEGLTRDLQELAPMDIWILVHSAEELPPSGNLFLGLKTGHLLAEDLVSAGLDRDRIQYLSVREANAGIQDRKSKKTNASRIEIRIAKLEGSPFEIEYTPFSGLTETDAVGEDFFTKRMGLSYSLHLGDAGGISQNGLLQETDAPLFAIPSKIKEQASYFYGLFPDFRSAFEEASRRQNQGQLRITAFVDGIRIDKGQIVNHARQYPDLLYLLDHYLKHDE